MGSDTCHGNHSNDHLHASCKQPLGAAFSSSKRNLNCLLLPPKHSFQVCDAHRFLHVRPFLLRDLQMAKLLSRQNSNPNRATDVPLLAMSTELAAIHHNHRYYRRKWRGSAARPLCNNIFYHFPGIYSFDNLHNL